MEEKIRDILFDSLITKNVTDISKAVTDNLKSSNDVNMMLAAYSGLTTVLSYFDYKIRQMKISEKLIEEMKEKAEKHVLELIADENNLSVQKVGEA